MYESDVDGNELVPPSDWAAKHYILTTLQYASNRRVEMRAVSYMETGHWCKIQKKKLFPKKMINHILLIPRTEIVWTNHSRFDPLALYTILHYDRAAFKL